MDPDEAAAGLSCVKLEFELCHVPDPASERSFESQQTVPYSFLFLTATTGSESRERLFSFSMNKSTIGGANGVYLIFLFSQPNTPMPEAVVGLAGGNVANTNKSSLLALVG